MPFETLGETTVLPISGEAYIKRTLTDAEATQAGDLIAGLARIHGISGSAKGYQTMPVFDAGRAEPGGIDVFAESADHALWIALLAPEAPRPDQQPTVNEDVLAALGGGDTGAPSLISIGVVPAMKIPEALEDVSAPSPVPVMWEITTQGRTAFETDYLTLDPLPGADGTNGLTRPGVLRLSLPDESLIWAPSNDVAENPAAGVGDTPPRIDDAGRAARLLAWLRLRPRAGQQVDRLPLTWVGINATDIDQRTTLGGRVLGVSTGAADQVVRAAAGLRRSRDAAGAGRGARPRLPALVPRGRSRGDQRRRAGGARGARRSSSTPRRARCASATACADACPSGRCACGWPAAASAADARATCRRTA